MESAIIADMYQSDISVSFVLLPTEFTLSPAYPNPFNPTTTIKFALPLDHLVSIKVYDIQGREVTTLIDGKMEAGYHSVTWQAINASSGVYFIQMISSDYVKTQKVILFK